MQWIKQAEQYYIYLIYQKNTYIIDGFPRNKENLDGWLELFGDTCHILTVLFLECPREVCSSRIKLRGESSGRIDDNEESLNKRFRVFENETIPNIENLSKITEILRIKADKFQDEVFECICKEFDRIFLN